LAEASVSPSFFFGVPEKPSSSVRYRNGNRQDRPRRPDITEIEQIAGLTDRSTQDLRVAWRQLHRTGPPLGLSRDLLIRALANQLQERGYGGVSRALRRRLQSLTGASEKGMMAVDPGLVLKAGTTLVRPSGADTRTLSSSTTTGTSTMASAIGR
jgi:hypothetical protein